jgi:DNA-directed RNA polymerase subunit RPC12/RpoP
MATIHRIFPKRDDRGSPCPECGWKMPNTVYALKSLSDQFPSIVLYIDCPECDSQIFWAIDFAVPQT